VATCFGNIDNRGGADGVDVDALATSTPVAATESIFSHGILLAKFDVGSRNQLCFGGLEVLFATGCSTLHRNELLLQEQSNDGRAAGNRDR